MWVVTGIFMIMPPPARRFLSQPTLDPAAAVRSPSEALRALPEAGRARVRSAELRNLGGTLVYRFGLQNGEYAFVNAATAMLVNLTDSLALILARSQLLDSSRRAAVTTLTQHDALYRSGSLPAYRIYVRDSKSTLIHVAADGTISETTRQSRLRAIMGGLHEFHLPGTRLSDRTRKALLIGASALTIVLICTGYILALPVRRRR